MELPSTRGLILYYDMETILPDGRMKDLSDHGNHGTIGPTVTGIVGKYGMARHFNGISADITSPVMPIIGLTQWSYSLWLFWDGDETKLQVIPIYMGGHWINFIPADAGPGQAKVTTLFGNSETIQSAANAGRWYHLAVVSNGTNVQTYWDGVPNAPFAAFTLNDNFITIGTERYDDWFDGRIDEVLVYNRALTTSEAKALGPTDLTPNIRYRNDRNPSLKPP